jgi:tetratricopeptide (TPR) repeat protein
VALPDLDAEIDALLAAARDADQPRHRATMERIEATLATLNPLERGVAFAHVHHRVGNPRKAATVLEDLLAVMGDDPVTRYQIGIYRRDAGDVEEAIAAFGRAAGLDPKLVDAWVACGALLDACGRADDAIDCYRYALLAAPLSVDAWRNLGNSLAALQRFEEAAGAYDTALGMQAGDATLALLRSSAYQARGEIARANALLTEAHRAELGLVAEVRHSDGARTLACRFHANAAAVEAAATAARRLLAQVGPALASPMVSPHAHGTVFVVEQGDCWLVCDPDPVRTGHPNRFFDASEAVAAAQRET